MRLLLLKKLLNFLLSSKTDLSFTAFSIMNSIMITFYLNWINDNGDIIANHPAINRLHSEDTLLSGIDFGNHMLYLDRIPDAHIRLSRCLNILIQELNTQ